MLMPIRPRTAPSIARRLARINMAASGTALLVAGLALSVYDFVTFRAALLDNQVVEAQIVGSNTITALTFDDSGAAERTLSALRAEPSIEGAGLYRPDGEPFASYLREPSVEPLSLPPAATRQGEWARFSGLRTLHVVRPVRLDGMTIGLVYIRSNLTEITDRVQGYGVILGTVLLVAFAASLLASRVSRRAIADPLTELAALARRFSADRDYSVRARETGSGELFVLTAAFNEMLAQIQARDLSLQEGREQLEQRVRERTAALDASNQELEAFCYSVSHDLRSPLRAIDGFSQALLEDLDGKLDAESVGHLARIRAATQRMAALIDDLLSLSRITRTDLALKRVDLTAAARSICDELAASQPERDVKVAIDAGLEAVADPRLMRQVLENLLGNAWKFTSKQPAARIEFGAALGESGPVYRVRDNGAGFDPAYADRLFGVFQRLHAMNDFPGTGVGLAIVERIVKRHGGRIWAESAVGKGATFYFTLGT
jgi:signal transduction histidine kinase